MSLGDIGGLGRIVQAIAEQAEAAKEFQREVGAATRFALKLPAQFSVRRLEIRKKTMKARKGKVEAAVRGKKEKEVVTPVKGRRDAANQFNQRNPELTVEDLEKLCEDIKQSDSVGVIYDKLLRTYPDVTLADEALEFLIATRIIEQQELESIEAAAKWLDDNPEPEDEFLSNLLAARLDLHVKHGTAIRAGYHASEQAREIADTVPGVAKAATAEGKTTPQYLRGMYRKLTDEQPNFDTLFQELASKYSYKDLVKVSDFYFHALGTDLNSEGPSIEPGKLHALIHEVKILQAVMGVFRFWRNREPLVKKLFAQDDLTYPKTMNFESLAKEFIALLSDRYPQSSKLIQSVSRLGADKQDTLIKQVLARIVVIEQDLAAIQQVDNKRIDALIHRRKELQAMIIETLTQLYEDLDDLESALEKEEFFKPTGTEK